MDRGLALLGIGLLFGGGIGFVAAAGNGITLDGHEHGPGGHTVAGHVARGHTHAQSVAAGARADATALLSRPVAGADASPFDICTSQGAVAAAHSHDAVVSVPPGPGAPTLRVSLARDASAGWNLHVETAAFRFAPERASGPHVPGEGHAHVYVNGEKVARLYAPWMHFDALPEGATVTVTLTTNDHRQLAVGDMPLSAEVTAGEFTVDGGS